MTRFGGRIFIRAGVLSVEFRRLNLSCCFKRLQAYHFLGSMSRIHFAHTDKHNDRVRFSWFLPMHSVLAALALRLLFSVVFFSFCMRLLLPVIFATILQCVYMNQPIQKKTLINVIDCALQCKRHRKIECYKIATVCRLFHAVKMRHGDM